MIPEPGCAARNSPSIWSFSRPLPGERTANRRLGRAKPVMNDFGSRRPSSSTMSRRTAAVAVAVRAIVGGLPIALRNCPSRA